MRPRRSRTFQLTCPMRGTTGDRAPVPDVPFISTHVPHAGHDNDDADAVLRLVDFNSRAPCGARRARSTRQEDRTTFQLTCPMRGTTSGIWKPIRRQGISTHVPHAGHDELRLERKLSQKHFNSRAPCGARHRVGSRTPRRAKFQLTCPMRGTTTKGAR